VLYTGGRFEYLVSGDFEQGTGGNTQVTVLADSTSGPPGLDVLRPAGYFGALTDVIARMPLSVIDGIVDDILRAYHDRRTVFLYGNGGSAALASHCACDLGKGTSNGDHRRLRVVSLADNVPLITAWANDSAYEYIFVEQLRNLLRPGDISFAISASGNSPNIVNALQYSRDAGARNIGITGSGGGRMTALCDLCLVVPSDNMQLVEDLHLSVSHSVFTSVRHRIAECARTKAAGLAAD
jgi:D-sedoheptulose 7-phosphate isomerase